MYNSIHVDTSPCVRKRLTHSVYSLKCRLFVDVDDLIVVVEPPQDALVSHNNVLVQRSGDHEAAAMRVHGPRN